ncbi:MAG: hypothetical protein PVG63_01995, partial [Anaerolineales bacterium]
MVGYNRDMAWNMIGNQWAVDMLHAHIVQGELRHACLFTGPDSIGKRTLAMQFAQAINCISYLDKGGMCGQCRACQYTAQL